MVARAALDYEKTGEKQTLYDQIYYSAYSWTGGMRKVIFKAEYSEKGKNIRFILTTLNKLTSTTYNNHRTQQVILLIFPSLFW